MSRKADGRRHGGGSGGGDDGDDDGEGGRGRDALLPAASSGWEA